MERLSLPRRNYQPVLEKDIPVSILSICRPELPKNPLPTWVTLPLDAKLPMIPGPRNNVLLYTTNLGEKRHKSTPELDFDLTDPYSQTMSNDYKPLHDPHLKPHLDTTHMRKRLRVGGFITGDGKVLCTLREYNEYRQYLRRINLALDRKRQTPERKSRRRKKIAKGGDAEGSHEWRVKQIKEKLQQQYERDKARYQRLMAEDEERRKKLRETQKSCMSEKEEQLHQEQERRHEAQRKRQIKENAKKMEMLQRWYEEDKGRRSQTERRRREQDQLRERKLAESWEERRRVQQQTIAQELRLRHLADEVKRTRLALRERLMQQRRQRQQSIFEDMTKRQREEREKLEEECAQRIAERMARRTARAKNKRRKAGKKRRPVWKSNWDMTQLLLQEFSDTEETPHRSLSTPPMGEHHQQGETRKVVSDHEIREQEMTAKEQDEEVEEQYSELKIRDFKEFECDSGALSSLKMKEFLTDGGIPTAGRLTANMGQLIRQNQTGAVEPEDLAHVLVEVNNYIASEVIVPAYSKVKEEIESKPQRTLRFSTVGTEHIFIPYDDDYSSSEEDQRDMEMEDDDLGSSSSRLAMAVDSLTRITKGPPSSKEQSTLGELANILCRLLEKLEHGEISPEDAARLARAAHDILGESPLVSDHSDTSLSSQSSTTSIIAAEMVRTSMAKVQYELLKQYTPDELNDFYALPPVKATSSELTGMSKFVAETALAMAVESLMSFTDGIISDQMLGKTKVVRSEGDLPLGKSESSESMSCSSDFIMKILMRVLERVRSEAAAAMPPRPLDGQGTSSGPRSSTSLYVQELLVKAVHSVQTAMASRPVELLHAPAKSETSLFVMDTLQRVVQEIQRSRTPSATSLFIEDLLCKITNETRISDPNLSWNEAYDIHQRRSSASITSIFIRDTLSAVLTEIEKETKANSSATSLFAQEIVCSTLKKCESAVRQEMLPSRKLSELTAAILNSQQCNEDRNMELRKSGVDMKPGCTQSLGEFSSPGVSATECLAENLIRTTLEKAQQSLDHGTISAEQVVQVLSKISASSGQVAALDIDGEAVPASSCTSQQAHSYVSAAIDKAIHEMASLAQVSIGELPMEGDCPPSAAEVSTFIQSILANAIRELSMGLVDESDIGELEMNLRYSLDALDQGTGDIAEFTRIDDSASDSDFESNEMAIKQTLTSHAEAESLFTSQKDSYIDRNNIARPQTQDSDSDEEDEVVLQPVYKGEPLHVDPQVTRKALGAISVKNLEDMDDPAQALPRNSFRSLVCPDLSDVTGLDTSSSISLRSQLEKASKGTLPSQMRLRLAAASKMAQTGAQLETHTEEKITKTKSLQAANKSPSRRGSDTSPYDSPGSSPKPSKITINRASLIASSAPSMKIVTNPTRFTTLPKIASKEKAARPKSSKKSLSGRTCSRTNPGSTSQSKLSTKKSSTTKSLADGKASVSSVKKQTSPLKQKSSNSVSSKSSTERRKSNESSKKTSRTSADKVNEDITAITTDTNVPVVTTSDTAVPPVSQVDSEVVEATPVIDQEIKVPVKKSSQQLPRESGLIEMTTSSNPPSIKRSTASCQSKPSNTTIVTSPSASQRSVNLAPRPSSGFQKTLSGVSLTKNTSPTEVPAAGGSVGDVAQTRSEEDVSGRQAGGSTTKVTSQKSGRHEEQN